MRFFFMAPRILGIRPGISLRPSDFRKAFGATTSTVPGRGARAGDGTASFVYVIEGEGGHHKIGVSRDPIQRIAQLQTGSHVALRFAYIGLIPGTGYNIEARAHELLDAHRRQGEWFLVPSSIAIGATLEAAGRLGEPITQVPPEVVPQITSAWASKPDHPSVSGADMFLRAVMWAVMFGVKIVVGAICGLILVACIWMFLAIVRA